MLDSSKPAGRESRFVRTIVLAESGHRLRQSISVSLRAGGYSVIEAGSGQEATQKVLRFNAPVQVLLANVEMPDMMGIDLAQRLTLVRPNIKTILLFKLDSGMLIFGRGWQFLPAPFESAMLKSRIQDLLRDPESSAGVSPPNEIGPVEKEKLTEREYQVLKLIVDGSSTKEVAATLGIAFKTSVGHRSRLMKKLGLHDSVSLVRYAIRTGLIDL